MSIKTMGILLGSVATVAGLSYLSKRSESFSETCATCGAEGGCGCRTFSASMSEGDEPPKGPKRPRAPKPPLAEIFNLEELRERRQEAEKQLAEREKKMLKTNKASAAMLTLINNYYRDAQALRIGHSESPHRKLERMQDYRDALVELSLDNQRVISKIPEMYEVDPWSLPIKYESKHEGSGAVRALETAAKLTKDVHYLLWTIDLQDEGGNERSPFGNTETQRDMQNLLCKDVKLTAVLAARIAKYAELAASRQMGHRFGAISHDMRQLANEMLERANACRPCEGGENR